MNYEQHLAHIDTPWPHEGACARCREELLCNYCGGELGSMDSGRCTNGRCAACHRAHCGPGPAHSFQRAAA